MLLEHYPDDPRMRLSPEALYQWIYNNAKDGGTWHKHLWHRRHKRRPHRHYRHLRFGLGLATHMDRKSRLLTLAARQGERSEGA
jgi:hypothetical protein